MNDSSGRDIIEDSILESVRDLVEGRMSVQTDNQAEKLKETAKVAWDQSQKPMTTLSHRFMLPAMVQDATTTFGRINGNSETKAK